MNILKMKKWLYSAGILVTSISCHAQNYEQLIKKTVDSIYSVNPAAVGFSLHIEAPDLEISWDYSIGYSNRSTRELLSPDQPILIASNTKPYVAATILRLVEMRKLSLTDPIEAYLTQKSRKILSAGGYLPEKITIKQLLSHTSGIRDYVDEQYLGYLKTEPNRQWTREKQIYRAANAGQPLAEPGASFRYADINYVLLGEIIEQVTKKPFYNSIRKLLGYSKNGFNETRFVQLEKEQKGSKPLAHQYWDKFDYDSYKANPSWDLYGGGGMVSTEKEMALFFQKLFTGAIIRDPNVLRMMSQDVPPNLEINYCLGIRKINLAGLQAYNHGGGLGTDVAYIPKLNATIAVASMEASSRPLALEISKKICQLLIVLKENMKK